MLIGVKSFHIHTTNISEGDVWVLKDRVKHLEEHVFAPQDEQCQPRWKMADIASHSSDGSVFHYHYSQYYHCTIQKQINHII